MAELDITEENVKVLQEASQNLMDTSSNMEKAATILQNALDENQAQLGVDKWVKNISTTVEDIKKEQAVNQQAMVAVAAWLSNKANDFQKILEE